MPWARAGAATNATIASMATNRTMRFIGATSLRMWQPVAPLAPHAPKVSHLLRGVVLGLCPLLQIDTLPRLCFLTHPPDGIFIWHILGIARALLACCELPRTPLWRSSARASFASTAHFSAGRFRHVQGPRHSR